MEIEGKCSECGNIDYLVDTTKGDICWDCVDEHKTEDGFCIYTNTP